MCKTNVKIDLYYASICKYEHKREHNKAMCKIVSKICVEQTERNEKTYFYLYPFGDLVQRIFQRCFYVCIE
jgi:hypothetical protein